MTKRYVHLTPRLQKAAEMLKGYDSVADIGSDHGRLVCSLLQSYQCKHVIATDISAESLSKAKKLISYIGLSDCVSFRTGYGLQVISENECDALAILGMGGILIKDILESETLPIKGAKAAVLQPMNAPAVIRRYLYDNCYHIMDDAIIREKNRFYQIFKIEKKNEPEIIPDWWPDSFFDIGFIPVIEHDPNLEELIAHRLKIHNKELTEAKGSQAEEHIAQIIDAYRTIIRVLE